MKLYEILFGIAATSVVGVVIGTFAHDCFAQVTAQLTAVTATIH
jgi:hypothetical protein